MCATCGCSSGQPIVTDPARPGLASDHDHEAHDHDHEHHDHEHHGHEHSGPGAQEHHDHASAASRTLVIEQEILAKNDLLAARNRGWFEGRAILAVNLMSSPGSGKTTLLERTIRDLDGQMELSVVEGDQETLLDAERIRSTGCKVVQINTGQGCHLDADMLARGLRVLEPASRSVVLIENVGNLVCPALFDLGERSRVVIMSCTEGDDKPLKYPHMFRSAEMMLVNKVDLLPYVNFDVERCVTYARQINPKLDVLEVSATRGDGLDRWYDWLRTNLGSTTPTSS